MMGVQRTDTRGADGDKVREVLSSRCTLIKYLYCAVLSIEVKIRKE
jgi:hypothetical protein